MYRAQLKKRDIIKTKAITTQLSTGTSNYK